MLQIVDIIAARVKALRKVKRITQEVLAERSGLSIDFLRKLETGKTWVSRDSVEKLAKVFEISEAEIFLDPSSEDNELEEFKKEALCALVRATPAQWKALRPSLIPIIGRLSGLDEKKGSR